MKLMICKGKGFNSISIKSLDDLVGNIGVDIGALLESSQIYELQGGHKTCLYYAKNLIGYTFSWFVRQSLYLSIFAILLITFLSQFESFIILRQCLVLTITSVRPLSTTFIIISAFLTEFKISSHSHFGVSNLFLNFSSEKLYLEFHRGTYRFFFEDDSNTFNFY